jgi:hypothetical protein
VTETRPANCRQRLRDEGKMYPRSGCDVCGSMFAVPNWRCAHEPAAKPAPMPKDSGPAFPCPDVFRPDGMHVSGGHSGMTLLDWFAGQALPQAIVDYDRLETRGPMSGIAHHPYGCRAMSREQIIAAFAYRLADAMIAEGSRT